MLLKKIEEYDHIYIACGYTDMRKGIDGLVQIILSQHKQDPYSNSLFLFCGRRRKSFKALAWEKNGFSLYSLLRKFKTYLSAFSLYYRRFDGPGASLQWPMRESEMEQITIAQLQSLVNGFAVYPHAGFEPIREPIYF